MYCGQFKGVEKANKSWYWLKGSHGKSAVGFMFGSMWRRADFVADPSNLTHAEICMFDIIYPGILKDCDIVLVGGVWLLNREDDTQPRPIDLQGAYLHGET